MDQYSIIGNIGQDAKVIDVNGQKSIQFHVAVNNSYKDKNGVKIEKTKWISCSYWKNDDKGTKVAEYLKAGTKVMIQGEPAARAYQGKDGVWNASLNMNVKYLEFVGGAQKPEGSQNGNHPVNQQSTPAQNQQQPDIMPNNNFDIQNQNDDDLPF